MPEIPDEAAATELPKLPIVEVPTQQERFRRMVEGKLHVDEMEDGHCSQIETFRRRHGYYPFPVAGTPCENCPRLD